MKGVLKAILFLLVTATLFFIGSCEKLKTEFNSENLVMKSQEISGYVYEQYEGISNYSFVIPIKIYVKGGLPYHEYGDYHFSIADGSQLPEGLLLDTLTGVIFGNGQALNTEKEFVEFELEVSDGLNKTTNTFSLNRQYIPKGTKVPHHEMQHSSPETSLQCNLNSSVYGVSLSMLGGNPPYTFKLKGNDKLPGGLTLNPENGVISGSISNVEAGDYKFRVQCMDTKGAVAISMCTSDAYEEYTIIVR